MIHAMLKLITFIDISVQFVDSCYEILHMWPVLTMKTIYKVYYTEMSNNNQNKYTRHHFSPMVNCAVAINKANNYR